MLRVWGIDEDWRRELLKYEWSVSKDTVTERVVPNVVKKFMLKYDDTTSKDM